MNRKLWTSLLALLAVLAAGVVLTSAEAAPPKKAEQDKDMVDLPPPPKSTTLAPRPKALSRSVYAGIKFLVSQQQRNGGWGSGEMFGAFGFVGGAPGVGLPGRPARGKPAQQAVQTDVANTSIAGLALLRAGYTPRQGGYSLSLRKAVAYVCAEIEKSDAESLRLGKNEMPKPPAVAPGVAPGGIRGGGFAFVMGQTQVQRKIGNNVDPFLAALFLSEARGKMPDAKSEKRLSTALLKVLDKIQRNQKEDGTWGDQAWAPVLGQALASRALNRARQVGVAVDPEKLARTAKHARDNFDKVAKVGGGRPVLGIGKAPGGKIVIGRPGVGGVPGVGFAGGLGGAAGVSLYATASGIGGMYDSLMTLRQTAGNARAILNSPSATDDERTRAKEQIKLAGDADKGFLDAISSVATMASDPAFVRGFGSDGGEEFLSFALIGEALRAKAPRQWTTWDRSITQRLTRTQNRDGSWSGSHCITGKTFCTATALMSLMSDRASIPVAEKPKK